MFPTASNKTRFICLIYSLCPHHHPILGLSLSSSLLHKLKLNIVPPTPSLLPMSFLQNHQNLIPFLFTPTSLLYIAECISQQLHHQIIVSQIIARIDQILSHGEQWWWQRSGSEGVLGLLSAQFQCWWQQQ